MQFAALIVDLAMVFVLLLAVWRDRARALQALKASLRMLVELFPFFILVTVVIGVVSSLLTFEVISGFISSEAGVKGIFTAALIGTVVHMPSLVAFPLAGFLLRNGTDVGSVAAFITTLTMIGLAMLPLEVKTLGGRVTLLRNLGCFGMALTIAFLMGRLL
ncbi:MAG: permease [Candidatus Hecatellales archaeon]|nr:MAG: permease [Candidatus Hecatellales archaeon]